MKLQNALSQPRALRALAITVCILTNLLFVLNFVAPTDVSLLLLLSETKTTISIGMLAIFLLLRHALRHITAAKASELDEMQLELRNEAYQLGYLVIRRVGLGVSIAGVLLLPVVQQFLALSVSSMTNNGVTTSNIDFFRDTLGARSYLHFYFSGHNLVQIGLGLVLLMTFTAYCFPLVILAWRYARIQAAISKDDLASGYTNSTQNTSFAVSPTKALEEIVKVVATFRRQLTIIAIAWPLLIGAGVALTHLSMAFEIWYAFLLSVASAFMAFTVWVMLAGMFKQQKLIRNLATATNDSCVNKNTLALVRALSITTGVSSLMLPMTVYVLVPTALFGIHNWWALIWVASFATLASQTASFMVAGAAAKNALTVVKAA